MIRIHHVAGARSFRVIWLCHEAGLNYEIVRHSFFDKSLRDESFRALSPASRVPAVEIDGQTMFESGAILEYLAESRAPGLARGPSEPDRARYLEWLHFGETIGQHLANLTQHHIVLREDFMRSPTVMRLEAKRLEVCLLAAARARQGEGICGSFSAADIALGYGLRMGRLFLYYTDPALLEWEAALAERPAYKAALRADGPPAIYTRDFYEAPDG